MTCAPRQHDLHTRTTQMDALNQGQGKHPSCSAVGPKGLLTCLSDQCALASWTSKHTPRTQPTVGVHVLTVWLKCAGVTGSLTQPHCKLSPCEYRKGRPHPIAPPTSGARPLLQAPPCQCLCAVVQQTDTLHGTRPQTGCWGTACWKRGACAQKRFGSEGRQPGLSST